MFRVQRNKRRGSVLGVIVWSALAGCSGASSGTSGNEGTTTQASATSTSQGAGGEHSTSGHEHEHAHAQAGTPNLPPMPTDLPRPPRPWAELNHQERAQYMAQSVMPAMTALLQAFDANEFSRVTCATCHGSNGREVNFRMPNGIHPLPAFGTEASQQEMQRHPRDFAFMSQRVVPVMAQLLGTEPYNPQTHQGFGCFNCHGQQN